MKESVFKALQSRNYRLYFTGQSVSLIGTWMQRTAVYWLVYDQTHSPFMLGVAVFANQFPSFLFSIAGGVISDRYDRYRVLLITQILSLIQAVTLTVLVIYDYDVWQLLALSVVLGVINAFDVPARQSLIYDMVSHKDHLPNAIALNSSMVHAARLAGPAIAGIVLEKLGASVCFLLNAVSFLTVIASMFLMRMPVFKKHERINNALTDLKNGFIYLKQTPTISNVMLLLAAVSLVSLPYIALLPVYAKEILIGDASTFGYLNSFIGLGALTGAIFLASLKTGTNLKRVLFINTIVFGVGLVVFSHLTSLPVALLCVTVIGFGMMSQTTISNTLIQTTVAPAMRGRVISFYAMAFFGMQPIGGILIGLMADQIGAPKTLLIEGVATLFIAFLFFPFLTKRELESKQKMKMDQLEERTIEAT
ncbi:MAG TPA: MFS transporter [Chryseosolibacter sp.]|nr:MFS transporter [Chryseosolibacter sp.]